MSNIFHALYLMKSIRISSLVILCALFGAVADASEPYTDELIQQSAAMSLSTSRGWQALLHYKPGGLFERWKSQADDDDFFLSTDGKYDPAAELIATIRAFATVPVEGTVHPQCRFPARYHWLKEQLDVDPVRMKPVFCEELEQWFDTLRPGSLTLVFPAAYINSPASMFGHTLLRVNPDDHRKDSPLVAYALNYAADADPSDNSIVFSIKGLIGGYPGSFSIVPYYKKIKEYSDLENRDVWEYDIDFSRDEVLQLMRHAWEVRHIRFDYFFLTENCSYHMLSLMEAARPELDLTSAFDVKAIPSDTVRGVIDADLVIDYEYRPSSTMILSQHATQLTESETDLLLDVIDGEVAVGVVEDKVDPDRRAMVYEQAYDYARFLSTADPTVRDARASINWQLLAARSKLPEEDVWAPLVLPQVRAEQGHATSRLATGFGRLEKDDYLSLRLRPAYHDVVDPPAGFASGAQINFLDLSARYYIDSEDLRLDKFTILNVLSLSPRDDYFSPVSWGVDLAVERQPTRTSLTNAIQLVVNGGFSFAPVEDLTVSLLGEVNAKVSSRFQKGHTAGVGIKLVLLSQGDRFSFQSGMKSVRYESGEENRHLQFDLSVGYHLGVDSALRLIFDRTRDYAAYRSDVQLSYHHYF